MRLAIVATIALASTAHAEPARVVVATTDRVLVGALSNTFGASGSAVVAVGDSPPAAIGELTALSRVVAEREHAGAVVWLLVDQEGATLVAYDRQVDRILVRPLPYAPPLSPAGAAETARAARTMLRALEIADEPERAATQPTIVIEQPPVVIVPPPARPWPNISVLGGFGGRYGRLGEQGVIEAHIAAAVRPDALGIVAMLSLSPKASLMSPAFTGNVSDNSFAVMARVPFRVTPKIDVSGMAGPAVHAISVDGTQGAEQVSASRFDLALRVAAGGSYALTSRLDLGLTLSMDTLLRRQRYEVSGGQVLVMPRLQASVGLLISVRLL